MSWSSNPDGLDPDPMAHLARVLTEDGTPVEAVSRNFLGYLGMRLTN